MAKKTSVTIPEPAILLPDQIRMAIPAIERRITDLRQLDLDPMIAGPEGGPSSDMQRYEG
jgi:hypothetical protein